MRKDEKSGKMCVGGGSAGRSFRGNGRFLKKAPQKLYTAAAGLYGGYDTEGDFLMGLCADVVHL